MNAWTLDGYTEIERLGEGGFGRVVLAKHDASGTFVAIKYLFARYLTEELYLSRFRQEALMLRRVTSPHVVRLYEFVETARGAAIVMEAVPGVTLRSVLAADGVLAPEASLAVLKGSLLGLAAAHAVGVAHRDYKPDNVLVSQERQSKLVDFGLAVLDGQAGLAAGSPAYMAPEQWAGQPGTPATDVYAATCVFFQCVTGHKPYRADDSQVLRNLHAYAPIPFGEVPEEVRGLVARGMAKEVTARPAGAREFVAELETVASAAYGHDWEDRGWQRLAERAAALVALSPLALLGTASALAPAGGVAAVTGGTAAGTGAVGSGAVANGVLGTVGAKIAAITAAVAVAAGGVVIAVTTINADETPAAVAQASVRTRTEASRDPGFDLNARYVAVSGSTDPAADQRMNEILMAPINAYVSHVRRQLEEFPQPEPAGELPHISTEAVIRSQTPGLLSVRYDFTLDSQHLWHSSWGQSEIVNLDLRNGRELRTVDVLTESTLTEPGLSGLRGLLREANGGELCEGDGTSKDEVNINGQALAGYEGERPSVQIGFGPEGAAVMVGLFELGYPTWCGITKTVAVPYGELDDLLRPEIVAVLPAGQAPASSVATRAPASSSAPPSQPPGPGSPLRVGRVTLAIPPGWTTRQQGLEQIVVDQANCPDPEKYSNCVYFMVTDNSQANGEQPAYVPGQPYRRSANGRACNAAGRKDLWQEGAATKVETGLAPVGSATAEYEKWTIDCVPKGSGETSGAVTVTQRIWSLPRSQVVVVDEWGAVGIEQILAGATIG